MAQTPEAFRIDEDARPAFMVALGLLPPYTLDDVKQAYLDKVKIAHPDHGGPIAEFRRIQQAYEQAQEFLAIQSDRRSWIASQMDRYIAHQEVEQRLREMGARLGIGYTDWLQKSLGDFAELTAAIESIELVEPTGGNSIVKFLVDRKESLLRLKRLVLVGCGITTDQALRLSSFPLLTQLDLSRNPLSNRVAQLVASLPNLQTLRVEDASVGWWGRFQASRIMRKRRYPAYPIQQLD